MKRIFLIGYMGAGKTTLGKAFAAQMGLTFIDLDWYIENRFHKTVQQIFEEKGEEGFRQLEKNMLHEAGEFEDVVIATGGGTPCFFDNMEYMNQRGETVFLEVAHDVLFRRLKTARQQRPLLAQKTDEQLCTFIIGTLQKRMPYYTKAKHVLRGDKLEDKKQIQQTIQVLEELLNIKQ